MRTVRFARTLPAAFAGSPRVALGAVPESGREPDAYVLVAASSAPEGHLALWADPSAQLYAYQQAMLADGMIVVGFGSEVHVVDWPAGSARTLPLASYFVSLHRAADAIYVASGEDVTRLDLQGRVVWVSPQVALDGVRVELITDEHVTGEADVDPPGDWRPFRLRAADGRPD